MQLARLYNKELYKNLSQVDNFVGDNRNIVPISNKCIVVGCFKNIRNCDITGLICQCCEIITCVPNWPTEDPLINGRSRSFWSSEEKNIIHVSRVSCLRGILTYKHITII